MTFINSPFSIKNSHDFPPNETNIYDLLNSSSFNEIFNIDSNFSEIDESENLMI